MNNLENLNKIVSNKKSAWMEEAKWREENETWLSLSFDIAIRVLDTLKAKGMTQKELAQKMDVSPQFINKVVKGQENLSLETIGKIGRALAVKLIEIPTGEMIEVEYDYEQAYVISESYRQQFFEKASAAGIVGLKSMQEYHAGQHFEYKVQAR